MEADIAMPTSPPPPEVSALSVGPADFADIVVGQFNASGRPSHKRQQKDYGHVLQEGFDKRNHEFYRAEILSVEGGEVVVDMGALQRMSLEVMRRDIAKLGFEMAFEADSWSEKVRTDLIPALEKYATALRDLEYMAQYGLKPNKENPFIISTELALQRALLRDLGTKFRAEKCSLEGIPTELQVVFDILLQDCPGDTTDKDNIIGYFGSIRAKALKDATQSYLKRTAVGIAGGLFLIVPMLIMVLRPGFVTTLVTTTVATIIFAAVVPGFLTGTGEVVSATAAYAAVLVVFVGTSLDSGSS